VLTSPIAALKVYWQKVLTPQGRCLCALQMGLMSARLLLPGRALPSWLDARPSSDFGLSSAAMEAVVLLAFLVQWCAWSELLYSLRYTFQPAYTSQASSWRRFALHIYGGFVFLFVLSSLATVHPLLGIGAMFLLFMSAEAQDKSLALKPIPFALLGGMVRSYRLISQEPWRFLGSLLLPGMVLYAGGLLLVWMRLVGAYRLLIIGVLVLWMGFFLLAQLRVALRAEGEMNLDVLAGQQSHTTPNPPSPELAVLKVLLRRFSPLCDVLAAALGLAIGSWLLIQLGVVDLLSSQTPAMAFASMVGSLSRIVTAFLALLVKVGFIAVVVAVISLLLMLVIGFGRREPFKPIKQVADRIDIALQAITAKFRALKFEQGATLGLGTLLTALGTVAVQTYDHVQKDQQRLTLGHETLQRQQIKEEEEAQARLLRNDQLVARIQQRVMEFRKLEKPAGPDQLRSQFRDQLLSELRDVLPELKLVNGAVDGERKGKLLRYLYESGLLVPNLDPTKLEEACLKPLSLANRDQPARDVQQILERSECKLDLYLHAMDFSGAMLKGAYLNNAFLPFLDLKNADMRDARLKGAVLRFAQLENTDLTGSEITNVDLKQATLIGANFSNTGWADDFPPKVQGSLAFYAVYQSPTTIQKPISAISWNLVKGDRPSLRQAPAWTFCPLDPQSNPPELTTPSEISQRWSPVISQGGSKCRNRRFDVRETDKTIATKTIDKLSTLFVNRDWSGSSFKQSSIWGMTFKGITLAGADLSDSTFQNMVIQDVSFAGANLQDATFRDSVLDNVDFTGANLKGLRLERVRRFSNPNYRGALINLESTKSFGPYGKELLRDYVYDNGLYAKQSPDVVLVLKRNFYAPLLFAPLPLRPQQLLYWMIAYPVPVDAASREVQ